jgi:hypothetical protein
MSADDPDVSGDETGATPSGLSRRTFLRRGTLTAAAVGVVGSIPGLPGLLLGGSSEAPALETGAGEAESGAAGLSEPLVAHVSDVENGQISLFQGEREIVVRSPALVRQLYLAARN